MGWREKLARYGPRLGVLVIVLFVMIGSVCVAVQQRQQYRIEQNTAQQRTGGAGQIHFPGNGLPTEG